MNSLAGSTAVVVLGMHRSGTSALSGLLAGSGYNMGKSLFGPQVGVNERGFFENSGVVGINESLFDRLGTQWDTPATLPDTRALCDDPDLHLRLQHFLVTQYKGSARWGLKDPRVSLLEPLWTSAVKATGATLRCLLICRHPLEVADSLARRDRFPTDKSLMLWMNYNLRSLETALAEPSAIITYEGLVRDPGRTIVELQSRLGLPGLASESLDDLIDPSLYRSRRPAEDRSRGPLATLAEQLYRHMDGGQVSIDTLAEVRHDFHRLQGELPQALLSHIEKMGRSEAHYRGLFYEAYDSWWWRLATPLRWLERRLRRRSRAVRPPRL